MATLSQIGKGLAAYAENELLPVTEGLNKIAFGAGIAVMYLKPDVTLSAYLQQNNTLSRAVTMFFADESGGIDIDTAIEALKDSVKKYGENGKVNIDVPLIGKLDFDGGDLEKLSKYIRSFEA